MSDFDVVRDGLIVLMDALPEDHRARSACYERSLAALDRIEADVAGLKVELQDAAGAIARLNLALAMALSAQKEEPR